MAGGRQGPLGLGHPPPGLPPEHQHGVGVGVGQLVEGGDERRHALARLERADEGHQRPVRRHAQGRQRGPVRPCGGLAGREPAVVDAVRRDDDRRPHLAAVPQAVGGHLAHADQDAGVAAARRMARRKKAALERRCHSGWSKKVQSWIVTAHGTGDRAGMV